jgi:membrane protein DedA with SNARE-associated domain
MDLAEVIQHYGYPAVFVGCLLEGETVLALAGLASHRGYLSLPWVMGVAALGGFLGDQLYFLLGRRFGTELIVRYPRLMPGIERANALLDRYGAWLIVGVRFMYGFRMVGPVAIGMSRIQWLRFATFNLVGALLWAPLLAGAGYLLGDALEHFLGDLKRIEHWVFAALVIIGIGVWLLRRRR